MTMSRVRESPVSNQLVLTKIDLTQAAELVNLASRPREPCLPQIEAVLGDDRPGMCFVNLCGHQSEQSGNKEGTISFSCDAR